MLLPKKPAGADPVHGDFFGAGDTRPLSIVNADNRIVANAIRAKAEPAIDKLVSTNQKGFLPGRAMLENVLDVEEGMAIGALGEYPQAAIFFDFKAAFPSSAHDFLMDCLAALGVPRGFRNAALKS